ncbi:MAG: PBPRA1643 family SWIM/SEC-C metal-binding motif protein [Myxococcales bacterium]
MRFREEAMPKLGSKKRPLVLRVQSEERAQEVAAASAERAWHYIVGLEPDEPEDVSDLTRLLALEEGRDVAHPPAPKVGRNDPCPCGSGKKFKRCCGSGAEAG